jgi:hypothetical protein
MLRARRLEFVTLWAVEPLDLDTGTATLDIALALEHVPSRSIPISVTGSTLYLDLVSARARARRSTQLLQRADQRSHR